MTAELREQLAAELRIGVPGWTGGGDGDFWEQKLARVLALPAIAELLADRDRVARVRSVCAEWHAAGPFHGDVAFEIEDALSGTGSWLQRRPDADQQVQ